MTEKARIVVCDDEIEMRDMLEEFLTDEGYAVINRITAVYREIGLGLFQQRQLAGRMLPQRLNIVLH